MATDWDRAYRGMKMPAPTDMRDLMPDPYGHFDRISDEKLTKKVAWIMRIITTLIAIGMAASAWTFYQQFN